jgi:hypothetical protein
MQGRVHLNPAAKAELAALARAHRRLRPSDVLDAAQAESSALHKFFNWDDTEAARLYRLEQASVVIRCLVTVLPGSDERPVRAYVALSSSPDRGYEPIERVLGNKTKRETLLQDALRDLRRLEDKYKTLSELAGVFAAARAVRSAG